MYVGRPSSAGVSRFICWTLTQFEAHDTIHSMKSKKKAVDWESFDWEWETDSEIAVKSGRSRERVRQVRAGPPGMAMCYRKRRRAGTAAEQIRHMDDSVTSKMTPVEVAAMVGCGEEHAEQCLRAADKSYTVSPDARCGGKYDWPDITSVLWHDLTDKEMAVRVGVKNPGVVAQWRRRHGVVKVKKVAVESI